MTDFGRPLARNSSRMSGLLLRKNPNTSCQNGSISDLQQAGLLVHAELRFGEFGEHVVELLQGGDGIWHEILGS